MHPFRLAALLPLVLLALPTLSSATYANKQTRPNIVWIFVEDMNDWMGCYGDQTVPTPNLDRLASRGVLFERSYMPAGVCSATRSAIALGAMQTSLGVHNHRSSRQRVPAERIELPAGVKTIYELMRESGYFVTSQGMNKNDFNFLFNTKALYDHNGGEMLPPHWRKRALGQPFFAQIQLAGGKSGPARRRQDKTDPLQVEVMPYYPDHPAIRNEVATHYDCVRQTDEEVSKILAALEQDGLLDSTFVFFWTDHGMLLHRHKQWLYEGGICVPLIVAGPGLAASKRREDLISGIDITATTLALAGVTQPTWFEGRDFFAVDHGPREYVISARDRCDYTIDRVRAVTTRRYKYLRNFLTDRPFMQPQYRDGRAYIEVSRRLHREGKLNDVQSFIWSETRVPEEFYDLENDPHEIVNLANSPEHRDALQRHRQILADWIESTDDQGQYPESIDSLRGVLTRWSKEAVNPEYDAAREATAAKP